MEDTTNLFIHKTVSFPIIKSEAQQKGMKNFSGITKVYSAIRRYTKRKLLSTSCCQTLYFCLPALYKCFGKIYLKEHDIRRIHRYEKKMNSDGI